MIKWLTYVLITFGLLGFLTLIPGFMDQSIYCYFRMYHGNTMDINDNRFTVPEAWIIDSIEKRDELHIYNLRSKNNKEFTFASVFHGDETSVPYIKSLEPVDDENESYGVYELRNLPPNNPVRYTVTVPQYQLIIVGEKLESVRFLASEIQLSDE